MTTVLGMVVLALPLSARQEPTLEQVMERVGKYVASYGEKAAVVVASEKYTQSVLVDGADMGRPRDLKAEFAIQIATDWQGKGLGRLLLAKLLRYLRERGTVEVVSQHGDAIVVGARGHYPGVRHDPQ